MPRWNWWAELRRSSHRERVHHYTRFSLYFIGLQELLLIVAMLVREHEGADAWAVVSVALLGCLHTGSLVVCIRHSLARYLGAGPLPVRPLAWGLGLTLALNALVGWAVAVEALGDTSVVLAMYATMFYAGPVSLALSLPRAAELYAVPAVASVVALGAQRPSWTGVLAVTAATAAAGAIMGGIFRVSGWTLRVLDQVNAAREIEARLAVAEERLRFGRDLHDVLGRNLSVIALKSELAAQLTRRGSPQALDQLAEVQRIARDSQREIREMVRGYREADLAAELAGARGVLSAAGIRCRVVGEETVAARLPAGVRSALGWVVREGATNVLRHSSASRCSVRLRLPDDEAVVELTMENDGVPAAPGGPAGSGLAGLRERLAGQGGSLSVEQTGGMFRLTARIPVEWDEMAAGSGTVETAERARR
ncbi:sensor histidine kinase [Streptomyces profundus]|uniref:sensor histidine kinase n=1 Tax=Streptomyces profundus TaxID=2867410 RepID=UPI001D164FCA|nr:histidine kinase [Streptomyces sp. MA3_2.13]UED84985.1 sensor histidine kinase [Streptomyces sp. MA3_2.13]